MYPRAANLVSPETQRYTDRELFWIVKHGIRFSGMPAFGKVETEEHIWNLVHYTRKLPSGPDAHSEPKSA
jgi:mono/diheme cytochrome c family protein